MSYYENTKVDHLDKIEASDLEAIETGFKDVETAINAVSASTSNFDSRLSSVESDIASVNTSLAGKMEKGLFPQVQTSVSATDNEINYLSGARSNIQDQIDERLRIVEPVSTGDHVIASSSSYAVMAGEAHEFAYFHVRRKGWVRVYADIFRENYKGDITFDGILKIYRGLNEIFSTSVLIDRLSSSRRRVFPKDIEIPSEDMTVTLKLIVTAGSASARGSLAVSASNVDYPTAIFR